MLKKSTSREVQRAALAEYHRSFVDMHSKCKKVRRTLRASSIVADGDAYQCERRAFERLMLTFEGVQLTAESLKKQIEASPSLFGDAKVELLDRLSIVEEYLHDLLGQYEHQYVARRAIARDALMTMNQ